jgi:hypothetical protein
MNYNEAKELLHDMQELSDIKQMWLTQIQGTDIWAIDVHLRDENFIQIKDGSEIGPGL